MLETYWLLQANDRNIKKEQRLQMQEVLIKIQIANGWGWKLMIICNKF